MSRIVQFLKSATVLMAVTLSTASFAAVLAEASSIGEQKKPSPPLKTVGGLLRAEVVDGSAQITLNHKPIYQIERGNKIPLETEMVSINGGWRVGADDIVLVRLQCGGSVCGDASWHLVQITPDGRTAVSAEMSVSEGDEPVIDQNGNKITVAFSVINSAGQPMTRQWIFEGIKLLKKSTAIQRGQRKQ